MDMDKVDAALARLARAPTPAGLLNMEGAVLERIAHEPSPRQRDSLGLSAFAAVGAMALGLAGGLLPQEFRSEPASLSPLTGVSELAPSSLLASTR